MTLRLLVVLSVLLCTSTVEAQSDLSTRIDAIARSALENGPIAGMSIAVLQDGVVLHAEGYGLADTEVATAVSAGTLFNVASVAKIVAAVALLRLVDEGRLDLDADLGTLLPAFPNPEQGRRITLRQLLNHTAGLNDYVAADYERLRETGEPLDPAFVLDYVRDRPLDFEPGTNWLYSNTGFYLAGLIVERVTGRAWGEFVLDGVVRPLGLDGVELCDEAGEARAVGYDVADDGGFIISVEDAERGVRGDAGLCATALDLARLPGALTSSGLLSTGSLDLLLAPTVLADGVRVDHGLGVARGSLGGHELWGHVGGNSSSNVAALVHYPDSGLSIAVLVNTRYGEVGALMVQADIARIVLGLGPPTLADRPLAPEAQARYVGTWVGDRGGWRYHVVPDGPRIARVAADDPAAEQPLLHQGGHAFGRADWPMDRFVFHVHDGSAVAYSVYYNGLFGGLYRRSTPFDVVLANGRVMDPETGLDGIRDVGITDGRIRAVSETPLEGREVIDATGLVVAPGFIDLNTYQHGPDLFRLRAADGVTAVLNLESGAIDVAAYYEALDGRALIHHGASVDHQVLRRMAQGDTTVEVMRGVSDWPGLSTNRAFPELDQRALTEAETDSLASLVERGLREGAIGVGFGIAYTPGATHSEILRMFELAARYDAPSHVHVRNFDPTREWDDLYEVLAGAIRWGGDLHIKHLQSTYGSFSGPALAFIERAREHGLAITTECYPYTAASTWIDSGSSDDWQEWPDQRFQRYEWPPTGERLTRESFARYRAQGGIVVIHPANEAMQEAAVRTCLANPRPMIASDGAWDGGQTHPRVAGTHSRVLGRYVREEGILTLMDALRKMSLDPADHLARRVPAMRLKGRVQVGADADLVLFNPHTVIDRATYGEPTLAPTGIELVLVAGVVVMRSGVVQEGVAPGQAIRGSRIPEPHGSSGGGVPQR